MWQDSIVEETRQFRSQYASGFENDPDAIFEDILRRQNESKKKTWGLVLTPATFKDYRLGGRHSGRSGIYPGCR